MKFFRSAAALTLAAALCALLLAGCGRQETGTSLSVCLGAAPETLDPALATATADVTVVEHLYENLMRVTTAASGGTAVTQGAARSYDTAEAYDGSVTYTFRLRDARWSDGRKVTADDFVYAWQRLAAMDSPNAEMLSMVRGYAAVHAGGDPTGLGVTAKNDSTLVVELTGQCSWFLSDVCTAAATMPLRRDLVEPETAGAAADGGTAESGAAASGWNPDEPVTNGPYCVSSRNARSLTLTANSRYDGKQTGPEKLSFVFASSAEEAWALYEAGTVAFVTPLPEEQYLELEKEGKPATATLPATETVLFNASAEVTNDPLVRRALSLAADRTALSAAAGAAAVPAAALVPDGIRETADTDFRESGGEQIACDAEGYAGRCAEAASLLEQSGYSSWNFPETELLYADGGTSAAVAQALVKMWKDALGVNVTARGVTQSELDAALRDGSYTLALTALTGSYCDAESFLGRWTSKNPDNVLHYANSAYDTLLAVINSASDEQARQGCLHDAESLLLEDNALAPLYFTRTAWAASSHYLGICRDARGWFWFGSAVENPNG